MSNKFLEEITKYMLEAIIEPTSGGSAGLFRDELGCLCLSTEQEWLSGHRSRTVFMLPEKGDDER